MTLENTNAKISLTSWALQEDLDDWSGFQVEEFPMLIINSSSIS
jgi:hypothetical protein